MRRDPDLDLYEVHNGFDPGGAEYSEAFRARFFAAQAERYTRLIDSALDRLTAINAGRGLYRDDEPFVIHGLTPRIWFNDLRLLGHTCEPHELLHADGDVTTQIVRSVRPVMGTPNVRSSYTAACMNLSVREFLSNHAVRTHADYEVCDDRIRGIDWSSSNTSAPMNAAGITVPLLIMPMTAHYFVAPDELILSCAGTSNKQYCAVEGAEHRFTPCKSRERMPGQFGDTIKLTFDHIANWLAQNF